MNREEIQIRDVSNANRSANALRSKLYVCPMCGNVLFAMGEAVISCCGIALPPLEAEPAEGEHAIDVELVEDEPYASLAHPVPKDHHVSFIAAASPDWAQVVKLYPEGDAAARFRGSGVRDAFAYFNQHGLFRMKV